jgi:hypothetical protein
MATNNTSSSNPRAEKMGASHHPMLNRRSGFSKGPVSVAKKWCASFTKALLNMFLLFICFYHCDTTD